MPSEPPRLAKPATEYDRTESCEIEVADYLIRAAAGARGFPWQVGAQFGGPHDRLDHGRSVRNTVPERVGPATGSRTQARAGCWIRLLSPQGDAALDQAAWAHLRNQRPVLRPFRRRLRPGSGEVGVYCERRTADQRAAEPRAICSGPGRCSASTAAGIAIGAGCSHRRFTVRASRTTRRSSRTRRCVRARIGPRTRSFGPSSR